MILLTATKNNKKLIQDWTTHQKLNKRYSLNRFRFRQDKKSPSVCSAGEDNNNKWNNVLYSSNTHRKAFEGLNLSQNADQWRTAGWNGAKMGWDGDSADRPEALTDHTTDKQTKEEEEEERRRRAEVGRFIALSLRVAGFTIFWSGPLFLWTCTRGGSDHIPDRAAPQKHAHTFSDTATVAKPTTTAVLLLGGLALSHSAMWGNAPNAAALVTDVWPQHPAQNLLAELGVHSWGQKYRNVSICQVQKKNPKTWNQSMNAFLFLNFLTISSTQVSKKLSWTAVTIRTLTWTEPKPKFTTYSGLHPCSLSVVSFQKCVTMLNRILSNSTKENAKSTGCRRAVF